MSSDVIVLDNGSSTVKAGLAGESAPRYVAPNCTARLDRQLRVLVADEVSAIRNQSQLRYTRPCERGQLTNVGCESEVWRRVFSQVPPSGDGALLVTEPAFSPAQLARSLDELIFEEFQFPAAYRCPAARLAAVAAAAEVPTTASSKNCSLVIDLGGSCTQVSPITAGDVVPGASRRHVLGGRALTGYLRELVSYRQYNMMDETALLDDVKCKLLFVSQDFSADLGLCDGDGPLRAEYRLPDFSTVPRFDDDLNVLRLESERFAVPELLFSPRDVGLHQAGIADLAADALLAADPALHAGLAANVVLCGGGANFRGLESRLRLELRRNLPSHLDLSVSTLKDPEFAAFRGAALAALTPDFRSYCTTKAAWFESGGARYDA
mmetsp:Transcript_4031/g.12540  ORF Transcript_4031/g.12540 Transcript_4031/m.12540 type:complete len:380 (-) Transcript_4031:400-1539(-)